MNLLTLQVENFRIDFSYNVILKILVSIFRLKSKKKILMKKAW